MIEALERQTAEVEMGSHAAGLAGSFEQSYLMAELESMISGR
jgi:hypothetical protein